MKRLAALALLTFCALAANAAFAEPDLPLELLLAPRVAGDRLSAAASGGTEADPVRFEEHDAITALSKVECSGATGDAAADDADIRFDLACERRPIRRRDRRMGVVRSFFDRHQGNPV